MTERKHFAVSLDQHGLVAHFSATGEMDDPLDIKNPELRIGHPGTEQRAIIFGVEAICILRDAINDRFPPEEIKGPALRWGFPTVNRLRQ